MEHPVPLQASTEFLAGPRLVGIILNWYLHGLLTVQYMLYLMNSSKDRPVLKFTVHFLFVLESTQSILIMADAFFWFVYNFSLPAKLFEFHLASIDVPVFDAIIALVVQTVYCWRIWRLSQWRVAPVLTFIIALVTAVCGFTAGVRVSAVVTGIMSSAIQRVYQEFISQDALIRNPGFRVPLKIWLIGSAFTDMIIASSMTYILLRAKRNAINAQSSIAQKIMRLLTLILETNAITAAMAIGTVAVFFTKSLAPPRTFFNEPGGYILGKLYSNCFMVLLNQRSYCHNSTSEKAEFTVELGTVPDFAFEGDARPAGSTSGFNSITDDNGSRPIRQLAPSKPSSRLGEGKELTRSTNSLSGVRSARA